MRNKRLDILRSVAVILVIIHHGNISSFFTHVGWIGVDLFFVLSGFLISGLLFSEYKKRESIRFKRFFIRRGLKIYPAFYAFLVLTAMAYYAVLHTTFPTTNWLHDIFFVMNYKPGTADHTWTLAVEEHFYIFLPVFLLIMVRFSSDRKDPFRAIPLASVVIAAMCLIFRTISIFVGVPNFHMAYTASHERMDSLFFGVLIGYLYHFRPGILDNLMRNTGIRLVIALLSASLLSTAYFFPRDSRFLATVGYSLIYLGFGGVLLLSIYVHKILPPGITGIAAQIGSGFAFVGMYSYSIYLWHGFVGACLPGLFRRALHFPTGPFGRFTVYFVGSFVVGIAMSKLIEYPILRLRDRLFPASQIVAVAADVSVPPVAAPV